MIQLLSGTRRAIGTTIVLGTNLTLTEDAAGRMQIDAAVTGGGGGTGNVTGSGTTGRLVKFTGTDQIGDSIITETPTGVYLGSDIGGNALLRVGGSIALLESLESNGSILRIRQLSAGAITLETGGAERVRIAANGSVVFGPDPTGSELVRIGGVMRVQRIITTDASAITAISSGTSTSIEIGNSGSRIGVLASVNNRLVLQADSSRALVLADGFGTFLEIGNGIFWGAGEIVGALRAVSGEADIQPVGDATRVRLLGASGNVVLDAQSSGRVDMFGPVVLGSVDAGGTDTLRVSSRARIGGVSPRLTLYDSGTSLLGGPAIHWEAVEGPANQRHIDASLLRLSAPTWMLRHFRDALGTYRNLMQYDLSTEVLTLAPFIARIESLETTITGGPTYVDRLSVRTLNPTEVGVDLWNSARRIYSFLSGDGNYYGWFDSTAGATRWRYSLPDSRFEIYGTNPILLNPGFLSLGNSQIVGTLATGTLTVSGNITASGDIVAFSDRRLKTAIAPLGQALSMVRRLRPVWFEWLADPGARQLGLIAQDVALVLPEVVRQTADRDLLGVDYSKLTALLIAAVQELAERVDARGTD